MSRASALLLAISILASACRENEKHPAPPQQTPTPAPELAAQSAVDLLTARKGFQTHLIAPAPSTGQPPVPPPKGVLDLVHYPSDVGPLAAYLSPDPNDHQRHPAIVWAHSGFGGVGAPAWTHQPTDRDLSINAFRDAGVVVMMPAWRGENGNPGRFELFYGEVNDLLAAVDYVSKLPYVDPERVFVGGHSIGGTLALLAATASDKFRAVFSFGGAPDVSRIVSNGQGYGNTPFDYRNPEEGRLRSAVNFTRSIRRPTFYFEGADAPTYLDDVTAMSRAAKEAKVPFTAFKIPGHGHFDILAPLTRMVAQKIAADHGKGNFEITPADLDQALSYKPTRTPAPSATLSPAPAPQKAEPITR